MTITPIVTQALNDLTVVPNTTDTRIDLFANFDDPSTTGLVARFDLYNADLGGGITEVLLFDQPGVGAPITVQNFVGYVERNEYVDTVIHRSVPGFIIQGGGFAIEGIDTASVSEIADTVTVITGPTIQNEFSVDRSNLRGTIAMAKVGGNPDSATSQWFFNLADNSANLDSQNGGFTVFGEVLSEADLAPLDAIATLPRFNASQIFNQAAFGTMPLNIDLAVSNELTSDDQLARYEDIIVFDRPELTFTILNNSNPTLVNASIAAGELILDYGDNQIGSAEITIQATTLLGESIQDTFVITVEDTVAPVINVDQTFSYSENQTAGYVIGNVVASDNIEVTGFTIVGNNNGFFAIDSNGNITLTDLGAASIINDFETAPNSVFLEIIATDAVNNSSEATSLIFTILDVNEVIPVPTVTIASTDANAAEAGLDPGEFTITLSEAAATDITVSYGVAGTATAGADYATLPGTVTIAAGETTATIAITPLDDAVVEDSETLIITLVDGDNYDLGATIAGTVTIANEDVALPSISLVVSPASVQENDTSNLVYTFTRTGETTNALTVNYSIAGTADATDYTGATPGTGKTIAFAAGSSTATVTIDPTADTIVESDETVALTLTSGTGYTIGTTDPVVGTIANDDVALPSISLAVSPTTVVEDGTANLVYTFTRTGATTNALTVNYGITGTATNGTDYATIGTSVTFAANSSTATVTVNPTADTTVEADETVALTLASGTGYTIGTTTAVTGTLTNDMATGQVNLITNGSFEIGPDPGSWLLFDPGSTAITGWIVTRNNIDCVGQTWIDADGSRSLDLNGSSGAGGIAQTFSTIVGQQYSVSFALAGNTYGGNGQTPIKQLGVSAAGQSKVFSFDTTGFSDDNMGWVNKTWVFTATASTTTLEFYSLSFEPENAGAGPALDNVSVTSFLPSITSITLAVTPSSVLENGNSNLLYTFTRTGSTTNALTVNYGIAGTADSTDYTQTGAASFTATTGTVSFAAGSTTAIVTIDPTADTTVESDETVALTLTSGTGYTIGTTETVVGTIANDDTNPQPNAGVLLGTLQNDTLDATTGQYTVIPLAGDDTIRVNTASDVIIELPNEGTDTIVSSVNYNLAAMTHIENLTLTGTDDITGIGNRRDNIITGNSGQNVLVGLQGDDTFVFNFGDSSVAKPDRIRDFGVGQDRIQIGDRLLAPSELPSTTNNTATTLSDLVNSVFADADGALSGNQPLAIDSAALVTSTRLGITNTYLVANDEIAGFNAETDLIINIASSSVNTPIFIL